MIDGSASTLLCLLVIVGVAVMAWVSRRNRALRKHRWKGKR